MDHLPDGVSSIIAGYLPPSDAINLSLTCSQLLSRLSLKVTRPRKLFGHFSPPAPAGGHDHDVHHGFRLPVISRGPVHSVLVSMKWSDQGWGNNKGRVFLVAEEGNQTYGALGRHGGASSCAPYDRAGQFGGRRVVFSSGMAPHGTEHLGIAFKPREGERYHVWYVVGGDGGHRLHLRHVEVRALLFGESSRRFGKAHDFLAGSNVLRPWDEGAAADPFHLRMFRTILESASYSIENRLRILPPLLSFFERCGVSEPDLSGDPGRLLVEDIESAWNDWEDGKRERFAYDSNAGREGESPMAVDDDILGEFGDDVSDGEVGADGEHRPMAAVERPRVLRLRLGGSISRRMRMGRSLRRDA